MIVTFARPTLHLIPLAWFAWFLDTFRSGSPPQMVVRYRALSGRHRPPAADRLAAARVAGVSGWLGLDIEVPISTGLAGDYYAVHRFWIPFEVSHWPGLLPYRVRPRRWHQGGDWRLVEVLTVWPVSVLLLAWFPALTLRWPPLNLVSLLGVPIAATVHRFWILGKAGDRSQGC